VPLSREPLTKMRPDFSGRAKRHFGQRFWVAEPANRARRLPAFAKRRDGQGLDERSAATEAGNPVSGEV